MDDGCLTQCMDMQVMDEERTDDGWVDEQEKRNFSLNKKVLSLFLQKKYKEEGKKEMSSSFYSQLPETTEMQLAKTVQEFQSEV